MVFVIRGLANPDLIFSSHYVLVVGRGEGNEKIHVGGGGILSELDKAEAFYIPLYAWLIPGYIPYTSRHFKTQSPHLST